MTVKEFGLAWIVVGNLNEAVKFYTQTLGLKLVEIHEQYGWAEVAGHDGGARLGIAQKNDIDPILPGQNAVVTLTVDNLAKSMASLSKKGVKMIGEIMEVPGQVKLQMCLDRDGNHFQLVEKLTS